MKKIFYLLFLLFSLSIITAGCSKNDSAMTPDKTISMALSSEPSSLDPAMTYGLTESTVELALFEGLVRMDENNVAQPALAESWDISSDGLTYTFHLRKGIQWSDGTPITAKDFVYSWTRVLNPEVGCGNAYMLYVIKNAEAYNNEKANQEALGIKALDDTTLEVTLQEPASYFIDLTSFHAFYPVPRHVVEKHPDTWGSDSKTIIGCGPYKITKWAHSSEIILEKNNNYWNTGVVKSDWVKMPISDSKSTRLTMLEDNITDLILDPPPADEERLRKMGLYKTTPLLGTSYLVFNVTKPPFDNLQVRKAFADAITRKELIEKVIKNGKQPAVTFVPPEIKVDGRDFAKESGSLIIEDTKLAKELLKSSGYKGESVSILYNTNEMNKAICESIQFMWKDALNVNVELINQETKVFYDNRENGDYQVAIANWVADFADPINFLDVFIDKKNDAQYHNSAYNDIVARAHAEANPARRAQIMHQAEKMLFDDCIIIPLYYTSQVMAVNPDFKGYITSPMGPIDLIKAYKEKH
ncbi:peptide ABC transporter substrate-binding protein [uncultured Anaerovibrio sp.]|uniref:peptide ABC transporter substrate-binding protein n=1 Tax=uncultured Anaerovibrio sp. TaxID=361586 RepID=UPI0026053E31|nr:peptide ABC transporter substrate-binding protein [uncultured Anaerovibrio sp.]